MNFASTLVLREDLQVDHLRENKKGMVVGGGEIWRLTSLDPHVNGCVGLCLSWNDIMICLGALAPTTRHWLHLILLYSGAVTLAAERIQS